jgi:hypothetical protein
MKIDKYSEYTKEEFLKNMLKRNKLKKYGLTREMMLDCIDYFIKIRGPLFLGDGFDAEIFEDILLFKFFNVKLNDIEHNIEPFLSEFEIDTNNYNL